MANTYDLAGQAAIVTGAAGGIGSAVVRRLASLGVSLICVDLQAEATEAVAQEAEDTGVEAVAIVGDVTDVELGERAVCAATTTFGRLDILVNNAGMGSAQVPIQEIDPEVWRHDIDVNLTSQFLMCRAALPTMVGAGYGRILNLASAAGMEGHPLSGGYAAAKAGVIAMTKTLGKELAKSGVIVNALAPALIRTPLLDQPWFTDEIRSMLLSRIPMGRVGEPEEVSEMIAFLVSPGVTFSTGAVFDLSGGRATY